MSYPFCALVGQEQLQLALVLNAICPALGGVLIRGEKGAAKSTAARALAEVLPPIRVTAGCPFRCDPEAPWSDCPHCARSAPHTVAEVPAPFVDLPLGATEDRVIGTLDFEKALQEGRRRFQPGLLASAHRGVLYIDEVNLLADHLVDVLLDAAALGVNTVEREGMTLAHPARFVLVGTMNPEEGDLRPQLLDRFGLMVNVAAPRQPEARADIVRRRLAFETDAATFGAAWSQAQSECRQRIETACRLLPQVVVADELLDFITRLCCDLEVDGLRADLGLYRAARALAAWQGRRAVLLEDMRAVAELVLPHRRRRKPFEKRGLDSGELDRHFDEAMAGDSPLPRGGAERPKVMGSDSLAKSEPPHPDPSSPRRGREAVSSQAAPPEGSSDSTQDRTFAPDTGDPAPPIHIVPTSRNRPGRGERNSTSAVQQGQYIKAIRDPAARDIALDATLRAAVGRGGYRDGRLHVEADDVHARKRSGRTGTFILFVVDASGSMAARQRMAAVKGTVLSLLQSAYEERDRVGVIAFRGPCAEVLLEPTASVELAERALRELPTGGRTPLAHALVLAAQVLQRERQAHPEHCRLLVLLSDGRANVGLAEQAGEPWQQTLEAARAVASMGTPALVLDTEAGLVRLGRGRELAEALAAEHLPLEQLSAEGLTLTIRERSRQQLGSERW